jgi:hypothetical protein
MSCAMSDFASAIVVLHTPRPTVVKAVVELDLPTWVAPARGAKADRIALFPNGEPKRIVRALAVHLPKALLVTVDVGDEIPVTVGVHRSGAMLAFVQLDDHASTKEVEAAVTKLAAAMAVPVPLAKRKANEPFRNVVYRLLDVGTVVANNHFTGLTQRVAEAPADFVGFAYVHDTTIRELTDDMDLDAGDDDDDDDEEDATPAPSKARAAAVVAPPKRTPRATEKNPVVAPAKSGKPGVTRIAPAEAAELSATFKHARTEPGRAEVVAGAEKELAKASNASEWLAIRRTIDPARVAADVMTELVSVIRQGRFANEGERATVVREAAAMLLGRALKAQGTNAAAVAKLRGTVATPAEQACWDIVLRMAGLSSD